MKDVTENRGSFKVLESLAGNKRKPQPIETKQITPEAVADPEWLVKARKEWLSIDNDYLFTDTGAF